MDTLYLPGYGIVDKVESPHYWKFRAEILNPRTQCPYCESSQIVKYSGNYRLFADVEYLTKGVMISLFRQRYRCKACGKTFMDELPGMDEQHWVTCRLAEYIKQETLKTTFKKVAEKVPVAYRVIRSIFLDHVATLEAGRKVYASRWMGLDEKKIGDANRFVITDVENNHMIEMLKKRDQKTIVNYLGRMPGIERVELVAIDMWKPYKDTVYALMPLAVVVVDKFHVLKMVSACFDSFRKSRAKDLEPDKALGLKRDMGILRSRYNNLNARKRLILDTWLLNVPLLNKAYLLREAFYDIYELKTRQEAEEAYRAWLNKVREYQMEEVYKEIITAMGNWDQEIFNYFDYKATNAYTESLNAVIDAINHAGRGYSFEVIRAKMLFYHGFKPEEKPSFKEEFKGNLHQATFFQQQPPATSRGWEPPSFSTLLTRLTSGQFWEE